MKTDRVIGAEGKLRFMREWIATKCPNLKCLACGAEKSWTMHGNVSFAPDFTDVGVIDLKHGLGFLPLICTKCGFVHWFHAKTVGVVLEH